MPASRTVEVFRGKIEAEVEPVEAHREVFFTDEAPDFKLILRNTSEHNFVEGSEIKWCIAIGSGRPEPFHSEDVGFELPPGGEVELDIGGEVLAYEGHGVIGVDTGSASGRGDPDYELNAGRRPENYDAVYSFSVWDRSQYEAQHEYPLLLQKRSVYLTAGIVVFAFLSLLVALVNLLATLINAGMI